MVENLAADYGWNGSTGPHSCGYLAPVVLEVLRGLEVRRVLDLGCGNGALCALLTAAGYDAVGVEQDEVGVRIARASHPEIRFYRHGVQDDPTRLLSTEQPFDAVVSTEVIEHLFSPHQLPAFAAGVLKPAGLLIVSTPYHGYLKNLALSVADAWDKHHTANWHGGHIKFWSRRSLTQLLAANGFRVVDFRGVGRFPYLWKSMILIAVRE